MWQALVLLCLSKWMGDCGSTVMATSDLSFWTALTSSSTCAASMGICSDLGIVGMHAPLSRLIFIYSFIDVRGLRFRPRFLDLI